MTTPISPKTEVYCVIGSPVGHSLSPLMHNTAFRETGYDGVYVAFEARDVTSALAGIQGLGIRGVSITIPHKVSVIPLLSTLTERARRIGAVNTLAWRDGALMGDNTDALGAVRALKEKTGLAGKKVLILGAGGAARAVGFGVLEEGALPIIANRTAEAGEALAKDLGGDFCLLSEIETKDFDVLVNTTSVGMTPNPNAMPVSETALRPGCVVMDIVYNPIETLLLKTAREKGCPVVDGVSMFVYQGVSQFEMWTGLAAPVAAMEKAVRTALGLK